MLHCVCGGFEDILAQTWTLNKTFLKAPVPPHELCLSVPGAVKKIITACYRSTDVGHC